MTKYARIFNGLIEMVLMNARFTENTTIHVQVTNMGNSAGRVIGSVNMWLDDQIPQITKHSGFTSQSGILRTDNNKKYRSIGGPK